MSQIKALPFSGRAEQCSRCVSTPTDCTLARGGLLSINVIAHHIALLLNMPVELLMSFLRLLYFKAQK